MYKEILCGWKPCLGVQLEETLEIGSRMSCLILSFHKYLAQKPQFSWGWGLWLFLWCVSKSKWCPSVIYYDSPPLLYIMTVKTCKLALTGANSTSGDWFTLLSAMVVQATCPTPVTSKFCEDSWYHFHREDPFSCMWPYSWGFSCNSDIWGWQIQYACDKTWMIMNVGNTVSLWHRKIVSMYCIV